MKRIKRLTAIVLTACMLLLTAACGSGASTSTAANAQPAASQKTQASAAASGQKVGVAMPTKSSERWIRDGNNMKDQLEKLGYTVDLQYAEDDVQAQVSQIENMITGGAKCLVIASIDSSALVNVLAEAKKNNIPVIAYDRLLMDTDAVSYYATFDNKGVGTLIGKYIEEKMGLKDGKGPFNIELFAGSPDDNNAHFLNTGAMEVLQPYIDSGKLKVLSGQTEFDKICTLRWSQETAQKRMEDILSGYYSTGKNVDIVLSPFDGISYGIAAALEGAGYKVGTKWPIITGQDAETMAVKNIKSGKQTMTVFKDTRILAAKCVTMVQAVMEGKQPEINDTKSYNNGKLVVPSYLCTPVAITKDNIQKELIDSNYYKESDIS
ncbi:multiple monosaccharide ABC transporter substrate-binding protein [Caproiciproducens galactitolivorans]|uniref:Sugar ABC transporter substrate-binding protein n=1 Tax=Caproiciproducens galactitolivorans TaxID=642589 RepID=A0ABT4BUC5_9FIRM|nr:multiple monosaccharide ABC transporter substrate-binding protein [Caproiciproducens galactitolivorans]MCY1714502.1 sugar ABC transporter substrate-binding protein [Caproiciproducens galactitolivorans]